MSNKWRSMDVGASSLLCSDAPIGTVTDELILQFDRDAINYSLLSERRLIRTLFYS